MGERAQAGSQRLHDQALVGAERSRVGIWLGLGDFSKRMTTRERAAGKYLEKTPGPVKVE
jgi:hypothetical protein